MMSGLPVDEPGELLPPWHRRKRRQTTHHREVTEQVTIIRKRHAFEGQTLAVINSVRRRGVLLVLVILPNGSRSLIPTAWTDWTDASASEASPSADDINHSSSLGTSVICSLCARSSTLS
jgi:hypothetical protein